MNARIPIAILLLLTSSCAGTGHDEWRKADVDAPRAVADEAACRRAAERQAERRFAGDIDRDGRGAGDATGARAYDEALVRYDAVQFRQRLFEECLHKLGYAKVRAASP